MGDWLDAERLEVPDSIQQSEGLALLSRLEARNYVGRVFEINQLNCRQLQLDIEAALKLCRCFAAAAGEGRK